MLVRLMEFGHKLVMLNCLIWEQNPGRAFTQLQCVILTCICLMAGVRLVKCDIRPSHEVTSDRHTT